MWGYNLKPFCDHTCHFFDFSSSSCVALLKPFPPSLFPWPVHWHRQAGLETPWGAWRTFWSRVDFWNAEGCKFQFSLMTISQRYLEISSPFLSGLLIHVSNTDIQTLKRWILTNYCFFKISNRNTYNDDLMMKAL